MLNKSISVVFPAYNEARNIKEVVSGAFGFLKSNFNDFEIIVVDDGSLDDTYDVCLAIKKELGDCIKVIQHENNEGYGAALRSGLFSSCKELVFYTDADNQFNISDLLGFIQDVGEYDLVIGYRLGRKDAKLRKIAAFFYNRLIGLVFGLRVKDIDCSFKLFKKDALQALSIERDNFFVDTELLLKAKHKGFKLKEIGVQHLPRKAGQSTVRFWHIFTTLSDILYFWKKFKGGKHGDN